VLTSTSLEDSGHGSGTASLHVRDVLLVSLGHGLNISGQSLVVNLLRSFFPELFVLQAPTGSLHLSHHVLRSDQITGEQGELVGLGVVQDETGSVIHFHVRQTVSSLPELAIEVRDGSVAVFELDEHVIILL